MPFLWSVFVRFSDVQKIRTQGPVLVKGARWSSKPPSVWLYTATQLYNFCKYSPMIHKMTMKRTGHVYTACIIFVIVAPFHAHFCRVWNVVSQYLGDLVRLWLRFLDLCISRCNSTELSSVFKIYFITPLSIRKYDIQLRFDQPDNWQCVACIMRHWGHHGSSILFFSSPLLSPKGIWNLSVA